MGITKELEAQNAEIRQDESRTSHGLGLTDRIPAPGWSPPRPASPTPREDGARALDLAGAIIAARRISAAGGILATALEVKSPRALQELADIVEQAEIVRRYLAGK